MIEKIIVGAIVLTAAAFAARSLYRTWSGRENDGCNCGGACKSCHEICSHTGRKRTAR